MTEFIRLIKAIGFIEDYKGEYNYKQFIDGEYREWGIDIHNSDTFDLIFNPNEYGITHTDIPNDNHTILMMYFKEEIRDYKLNQILKK